MVAEILVVENLADDALALDGLVGDGVFLGEGARLAVAEVAEDLREFADVVGVFLLVGGVADAAAFVAEAFLHLHPERAGVDELHLALAGLFLPVGEHPEVGGDAGVVEELLGQGDDGLQPVVLDDPAADFAFAAAGVAGEEGRAVEDDGEAAAAVLRGAHLGQHVLEEEERAVVHAGRARAEAPAKAEGVALVLDVALLLLPLHAEGRIGEHVVEGPFLAISGAVEAVLGEGVAEDDGVGVLALDEHVGLADGPSFVVPVLAEELGLGIGVEVADVFLGDGQHATRAAGGIVDGFDHMTAGEVFLRREEEIDHELDHLARGEMFPGFLVGLFRADPDEFLEDVTHLDGIDALG